MKEVVYGCILNVFLVVGLQGNFGQSNYVVIKVGVIGLIKVWVCEFGCCGVMVNVVVLGFIVIEMINIILEKVLEGFRGKSLFNCLGELVEVVNVYVFFVFDEVVFIIGIIISVDGGVRI